MKCFKAGDLLRYGEAQWSLMQLHLVADDAEHSLAYGESLLGGWVSALAVECTPVDDDDEQRWEAWTRYREQRALNAR